MSDKLASGGLVATATLLIGATAPVPAQGVNPPRTEQTDQRAVPSAASLAYQLTGEQAAPNAETILPRAGDGTIDVGGEGGLSIGLPPVRGVASQSQPLMVTFDSYGSNYSITSQSTLAGARSIIRIDDGSAPIDYRFELDPSATAVVVASGGVEVTGRDGGELAYFEPPWAVDANGEPVPTHFEVDGNTVIQIIEHRDAAYPVTADPAVQADCGWVTCTIRFDRARTKWIADNFAPFSSYGNVACMGVPSPVGKAACVVAMITMGWGVSSWATDYYNNGNCFGFKVLKGPMTPTGPTQVNYGSYNCHK